MSVEQTIIESNQIFIDKVIKENESLLNQISSLKQEISQAQLNINKLQAETMKSVEPKINQLIKSQKEELEKQRISIQSQIDQEHLKYKEENEKIKLKCEQDIKDAENKKKLKIEKIKLTAVNRENELKAAIEEKIKLIPSKIEKAKKKIIDEEEIFRKEWEKIIYEKLKKEFQERSQSEQETMKNQQEQRIIDIVNQVELSAHDDAKILQNKIDKESKEHQISFNKLKQKLRDLNDELNSLIDSEQNSQNQADTEIKEMKEKISKCQCNQYREIMRKLNIEIADREEAIEEVKKVNNSRKLQKETSTESLKNQLQKEIDRNQELVRQQKIIEKEFVQTQNETQKKLNALQEQHKQQIALIGERVKQTVTKKDQVIQDLKDKLSKFGFNH